MGVFGMTVTVAESIQSRLATSHARDLIDSAANNLQHIANISNAPAQYGVQPESGTILSPGSVMTAQSIAGSLFAMRSTIDRFAATLSNEIGGQANASKALTVANYGANAAAGLFGAGLVRQYNTRVGVQYGPLFRHPNDPRIRWGNQGFAYNSKYVFTGNNYSSRWVNRNAATRAYGRANNWIAGVGSRIPAGLSRALGPIGIVVGAVTSYSTGYDTQVAADQGRGFTPEQTVARAQTRGTAEAVGSTVGAVALGAVGAAIGGPVGAVVGGMIGGWLGGLIGGAVADGING